MSKGSNTTRSSGASKRAMAATNSDSISPFRESEKAIQVQMRYSMDIAPNGGFTSSMVQDRMGAINVWIPKSQIKDGQISEWVANKQKQQQEKYFADRMNGRIISSFVEFIDAKGKTIKIDNSETKEKIAAGAKKHDDLLAQAKSLGIKGARKNMRSATLQNLIDGAKNGNTNTRNKSGDTFQRSATKISAGSAVTGKYGEGVIQRVLTKSSGYVEVKYNSGRIRKEMAFNLKGEDGLFLKKKPN